MDRRLSDKLIVSENERRQKWQNFAVIAAAL